MVGSATIGALNVKLGLDTAQFDAGIKKTQSSLKGLNFGALAGAATGTAIVAGLTTAFVALRNAMSFGDDIADTAKRLAVTTDALQEYRYAVHQLGGDYADADRALEGFSKTFGAAHAGLTKKAAKPFEALGLDPKQFSTTEEALDAVIKKIANLGSTAEQAAIADKLGIGDILPAIRDGGDAIDDLRKKAHDLGFVMSADVVNKLGDANDKFEDLEKILRVKTATAMADLLPLATSLATEFGTIVDVVGSLISNLNRLNNWKGSDDLMAMFRWANQAGAATGKLLGTDNVGKALGLAPKADLSGKKFQSPDRTFTVDTPRTGKLLPVGLTGKGGGSKGPRDRSADEIAAAERDELRARLDLTGNIEDLAKLRSQEIAAELKDANQRADEQVAQGSLSASAAEAVKASNARTAGLKQQALDQDIAAKQASEEFDHRDEINRLLDQTASIQGEFASTATERNKVEALTLAAAQKLEREKLDEAQRAEKANDAGSDSERAATKAALADKQAAEKVRLARESLARTLDEQDANAKRALDLQVELLGGQADLANSSYERAQIELEILKLQQDEERRRLEVVANSKDLATYSAQEVADAKARLAVLPQLHANQIKLVEAGNTLLDAFASLADAVGGMVSAFKRGDIGAGISALGATLQQIAGLTSGRGGGAAGGLAGSASGIGGLLGGVGAIGGLFGGGGAAAGGAAVLAGATAELGAAGAAAGGLAGSLGAIGSALGPIGAIVGAVGLLGSLLKGKPSNKGAGFDLVTGAISGKSRDADTEAAAVGTGKAILQAQAALKKLGATLTSTVNGLVIGSRDLTQIYLSNGKTLTSAIGDTGAATETALHAVLEAAQFADKAQQDLAKSMLESGAAASEIIDALTAAADDAKQKAEDIVNKRRDLEIQLMEAQGDAQGALNARREDELKALAALDPALTTLQQAIYNAQDLATLGDAVSAARDREATAMQATIDKFQTFADRLKDLRDNLRTDVIQGTPAAGRSALLKELKTVAGQAVAGDEGAQGKFQSTLDAFLGSAKSSAKTTLDFKRDQALALNITDDTLAATLDELSLSKLQLDSMNKQVDLLLGIKTGVATLDETIKAFLNKKFGAGGSGSADPAANFNAAAYLAQNPDIGAAFNAGTYGAGDYSSVEDFALHHYLTTGLGEIAAGGRLPGFASGGTFRVGGTGGMDSQLTKMWNSPGEMVSVSKGDPRKEQKASDDEMRTILKDIRRDTKSTATALKGSAYGGRPLLTQTDS